MPLLNGFSVSVNVAGPVILALSDYGEYEAAARLNLHDQYFPVVEVGYGAAEHDDEVTGIYYKTQAPYFRIGCDLNLLKNKHSPNRLYAGLRYAFTTYKVDISRHTFEDPVWQWPTGFSISGESCNQHWAEVVFGLQSRIVGPLHLGWSVRYKLRLAHKDSSEAAQGAPVRLDGINVDFESMNGPEVGDAYIQFLRELSIKCENNDIILSTDVAVPAAYNDFYSYGEQGVFVDYIIIMGYDEHYGQASGEGSVASLNWTEEAVSNMLAEGVPADQIVLGIPFYTKLWSLTPRSEENSSEVTYVIGFENLGMNSAKKWMNSNVEEPVWLEDCGQYYGEINKDGVIYKMWLEDTTSLEKRLQMLKSYNLAGAAFWKSGLEAAEAWDVIIKYIN